MLQLAACATTLACGAGPSGETNNAPSPSHSNAPRAPFAPTEEAGSFVDPVEVSPDRYRVLEVTANVRVLTAEWPAAATDQPHSHPTTLWYALTDAKLQIEAGSAHPLTRSISAGNNGVQGPVSLHSVRNVGDDPAAILMFEIGARLPAASQVQPPAAPRAIAAGNHFQLLQEHEGFRLVLASIEPNRRDRLHSHPPTVWVALDQSHLRFSEPGSQPVEFHLSIGDVLSRPTLTAHTVTNLGTNVARFLLLEAVR